MEEHTRKCSSCKQSKPLAEFSKNKVKPLGISYQCKPCKAIADKKYRKEHKKEINTYYQSWKMTRLTRESSPSPLPPQESNKRVIPQQESNKRVIHPSFCVTPEKLISCVKRLNKRYPQRHHAQQVLKTAIKNGFPRERCCVCGSPETQGHAFNYDEPLEVTWLCRNCCSAINYGPE